MKEKKITETITLYRLNFSLIVIAIFGIIGWLFRIYEGSQTHSNLYLGLLLLFCLFVLGIFY